MPKAKNIYGIISQAHIYNFPIIHAPLVNNSLSQNSGQFAPALTMHDNANIDLSFVGSESNLFDTEYAFSNMSGACGDIIAPYMSSAYTPFCNNGVGTIGNIMLENCQSTKFMFYNAKTTSVGDIYIPKATNIEYMFCSCTTLTNIGIITCNNVTSCYAMFGGGGGEFSTGLINLGGLEGLGSHFVDNDKHGHDIDLNKLPNLTYQSIQNVINTVGTVPSSVVNANIILSQAQINMLSNNDIVIAEGKNWNIVNADMGRMMQNPLKTEEYNREIAELIANAPVLTTEE